MDHLHRLIAALVLALASVAAHASFPQPVTYNYANSGAANFASASLACNHYASTEQTKNPGYAVTVAGIKYNATTGYADFCSLTYQQGTGAPATVDRQLARYSQVCPANSTGTTTCTCSAGFTQQADSNGVYSCVDLVAAECGSLAGQAPNSASCSGAYCSWYSSYPYPTTSGGDPTGCMVMPSGGSCGISGDLDLAGPADGKTATGPWVVRASNIKFTGSKCDAAAEPGPDDKPAGTKDGQLDEANSGKCPGTVNGVEIWVPCSTTVSQKKTSGTSTTTNPDGTTTTTTEGKTSTTECKGGVCVTTTTTTKTENGETTTTSGSTTASKGEYCKANASDPQCGEFSSWGGSCAAGFQCSGDAVMCAAAQAAWQQKCALIDGPASPNSEQQAYAAGKAGGTGYEVPVSGLAISSANFDSSNSLGVAGQCISDLPIVVWGNSISLPLSEVCPHLAMLGTVMLAIAWLMAAVIVGKGVQG